VKWAVRAAIGAVVLAAFALGVLVFTLPRLARSDAARARIQAATRDVLGAELRYADLDFGLLPPSLVVREPTLVAVADAEGEPLARAGSVALRVQLLPLLQRRLEVSSLVVDGLALSLVRDAQGIALPGASPDAKEEAPAPDAPGSPPAEDSGVVLGIQTILLRDASVSLEDRTVSPPRTSTLEDIDLRVRSAGAGSAHEVLAELEIARSDVALSGVELSGPLAARFEPDDLLAGVGAFEIDADDAVIRRGADFTKPAGTRARIRGDLVRDEAGALGVDALVIELHDLVAEGSLRTGDDLTLRLAAAPTEVAGWEQLVPALGLVKPRGRIAITELVAKSDLAATHGRFRVDTLEMQLPESGPLSFTGDLVLAGASLFARDAKLLAAGQPFTVSPKLDGLDGAPRFELRFDTAGADTDALLGAFAGLPDRLLGPLVANGTLRGPLSGEKPFLETLAGEVQLGIEGGRLVGASLLEAALGSLGQQLAATTRQRGAKQWERFYSEEFESLGGKLRLGGGRLVTEPATLRYRDYGVRLEGAVRLSDLELDLHGVLSLGPAVDAELARAFGAPDDYVPAPRDLVIQSLRGTPTAPKVQLAGSSIASLATHYVKQTQRDELKRAVEKELGPGTGEAVDRGLDVLEGLLGGGKR
jgi:hypothetical protein